MFGTQKKMELERHSTAYIAHIMHTVHTHIAQTMHINCNHILPPQHTLHAHYTQNAHSLHTLHINSFKFNYVEFISNSAYQTDLNVVLFFPITIFITVFLMLVNA